LIIAEYVIFAALIRSTVSTVSTASNWWRTGGQPVANRWRTAYGADEVDDSRHTRHTSATFLRAREVDPRGRRDGAGRGGDGPAVAAGMGRRSRRGEGRRP